MDMSIFFAKFLGLYLLIIGALLLFRKPQMILMVQSVTPAAIFFSGLLAILFGLFIVILHNVWVMNWKVLITLIGYLALVKGVIRLFMPETIKRVMMKTVQSGLAYAVMIIVILALGVCLTYHGFSP